MIFKLKPVHSQINRLCLSFWVHSVLAPVGILKDPALYNAVSLAILGRYKKNLVLYSRAMWVRAGFPGVNPDTRVARYFSTK